MKDYADLCERVTPDYSVTDKERRRMIRNVLRRYMVFGKYVETKVEWSDHKKLRIQVLLDETHAMIAGRSKFEVCNKTGKYLDMWGFNPLPIDIFSADYTMKAGKIVPNTMQRKIVDNAILQEYYYGTWLYG